MNDSVRKIGPSLRLLGLSACLVGAPCAAQESAGGIARGTEGLAALAFSAENRGAGRIACGATLAHWYSVELGEAGHGESVRAVLWLDSKTGEVFALNAKQDRMPVQALWCGIAGRSWATRAPVALPSRAGAPAQAIHLTCEPRADRLLCR